MTEQIKKAGLCIAASITSFLMAWFCAKQTVGLEPYSFIQGFWGVFATVFGLGCIAFVAFGIEYFSKWRPSHD